MTRKRASLAGRGVEILFGREPADSSASETSTAEPPSPPAAAQPALEKPPAQVEPPPVATEEPLAPQSIADVEHVMAAEWEAILKEEAVTAMAEGGTAVEEIVPQFTAENGRPDWPAVAIEQPPAGSEGGLPPLATTPAQSEEALPPLATTPAQPEKALPSWATEAIADEEPLPALEVWEELEPEAPASGLEGEPVSAPPPEISEPPEVSLETPPSPMYTGPEAPVDEPPAPLPPPKEKPEAADPLKRIQIESVLYSTEEPSEEDLAPADGFEHVAFVPKEIEEVKKGQTSEVRREHEVLEYIGIEQRQELWDEIKELYQAVPDALSTDKLQGNALRLLREAQDILLEKPHQFDVAQFKVGQVQSIVKRRVNINRWTNTYGWGAFAYLILSLVLLLIAFGFSGSVASRVLSMQVTAGVGISEETLYGLWSSMAWGGMGGVLGALYSLYWHAAKVKDFDKQYMMWYVVQPVIGLPFGALAYAIIGSGFISATAETSAGERVAVPLFAYVVACIASFRQGFILEVIDRIMQLLTSGGGEQSGPAPSDQIPGETAAPPEG